MNCTEFCLWLIISRFFVSVHSILRFVMNFWGLSAERGPTWSLQALFEVRAQCQIKLKIPPKIQKCLSTIICTNIITNDRKSRWSIFDSEAYPFSEFRASYHRKSQVFFYLLSLELMPILSYAVHFISNNQSTNSIYLQSLKQF